MPYPSRLKVGPNSYEVCYEPVFKATSSVRIKKGVVILRLSRFLHPRKRDETVKKFLIWAARKLSGVRSDFVNPTYEDGARICTHNRAYELRVVYGAGRTRAVLKDACVIEISLPESDTQKLKYLTEKIIMRDQSNYLLEVLIELNQLYFQADFKRCRFKRMQSRFGSCSSKGTINIAYRLLFAPREVFRYVCLHELAHLKEFNHSRRFWDLIVAAMPEYREYEKWLRESGFVLG